MLEWESHQTIDRVFFIKEVFAWQDSYVCCDIKVKPIWAFYRKYAHFTIKPVFSALAAYWVRIYEKYCIQYV